MKIVSINTNGIRAAARKGFFEWMQKERPDVVCIQETKAQEWQLDDPVFHPQGYHAWFHDAEKKGYSGVAIYARKQPDRITMGLGEGWEDIDAEGRFIQVEYGDLRIASLYMHSGSSSDERQQKKFDFMERFRNKLDEWRNDGNEHIICGDWNIAHKKIDLKNWRSNQKNSGFLPQERAWMDWLFGEAGWVDVFRVLNQEEYQYTWWSNRGQAWLNNTGWRIDYHVATPGIAAKAVREAIYKDERFSDHAPLVVEYEYNL